MVPEVARKLEGLEEVKDVVPDYASAAKEGSFTHRVVQAQRALTWAGVIVSVLVGVAGIFIVHNTIRLALHSRWREIYVMQLVGATRGIIAAPFLLEGMLHGAFGAALACCILIPAHMYLRSLSARSAPFFFLLPDQLMLPFGFYLLLAGAVLGLSGSIVSIRRYLRRRPEWHG
jgi:cell division transport system permease protein